VVKQAQTHIHSGPPLSHNSRGILHPTADFTEIHARGGERHTQYTQLRDEGRPLGG
jgi:hypothetical protein